MEIETADQREWLAQQFESLASELERFSPSDWAEAKRYLPPSVTPMPGPFRFAVAPYMREIVDCFSFESPIREVAVMKGVQICFTSAGLENVIGYGIEHVRTAPMMLVTADAELAKLRMDSYVTPMLQHSGLDHLIKSSDEISTRKAGKTDKRVEWVGGGFLVPFGAQNANKLRSMSIQILLNDEVDGWPDKVGKDGDPVKLVRDRTAAYESSRKILDGSTPLLKGSSKIEALYKRGDQRKYFVRCLRCEHAQELRWEHIDNATGVVAGMRWDMDGDRIIPGSVRYLCQNCGHAHVEADKAKLLSPEYGAEWRPTAVPALPTIRSYHISALYSPPGMQSWEACVMKWLEAYDVVNRRPRDLDKLQVFYNNVLGVPFEQHGEKVRFEAVSGHKRAGFSYGQVPNRFALEHCGSPILLLTCAVDVHKDSLKVSVIGWARDQRSFLVEYRELYGDTEQIDDAGTWVALSQIIESERWKADDGKAYAITLTLIDSGYRTDTVYAFCGQYEGGVFPIKGQAAPPKAARIAQFTAFEIPSGLRGYGITVDLYKDRWSARLRRIWDGMGHQPPGHFNAPANATDKQLKELAAETKVARKEALTGKVVGYEWHRTAGVANELWDLVVYNSAALDIIAWSFSEELGRDQTDWSAFWDHCSTGAFFEQG